MLMQTHLPSSRGSRHELWPPAVHTPRDGEALATGILFSVMLSPRLFCSHQSWGCLLTTRQKGVTF